MMEVSDDNKTMLSSGESHVQSLLIIEEPDVTARSGSDTGDDDDVTLTTLVAVYCVNIHHILMFPALSSEIP